MHASSLCFNTFKFGCLPDRRGVIVILWLASKRAVGVIIYLYAHIYYLALGSLVGTFCECRDIYLTAKMTRTRIFSVLTYVAPSTVLPLFDPFNQRLNS